jgi:hypothetical protein
MSNTSGAFHGYWNQTITVAFGCSVRHSMRHWQPYITFYGRHALYLRPFEARPSCYFRLHYLPAGTYNLNVHLDT